MVSAWYSLLTQWQQGMKVWKYFFYREILLIMVFIWFGLWLKLWGSLSWVTELWYSEGDLCLCFCFNFWDELYEIFLCLQSEELRSWTPIQWLLLARICFFTLRSPKWKYMNEILGDYEKNSFISLRKTSISYNWPLILNWHWLSNLQS